MVILFCLDEGNVIWRGKPKRVVGERERPGVLVVEAGDLRAPWHFQPYCRMGQMFSVTALRFFSRQTREILF